MEGLNYEVEIRVYTQTKVAILIVY